MRPNPGTKSEAQTERRIYTEETPAITRFRVVTGGFSQHHLGYQWVPAQRLRRHLSTTPRDRAKSPAGLATGPWLRGEAIGCPSPGRCPSEHPPNLEADKVQDVSQGDPGSDFGKVKARLGGGSQGRATRGTGRTGFHKQCTDDPYAADPAVCSVVHMKAVGRQGPPLSTRGPRLAILKYQGSDPTQPYPTFVVRQSARL